MAVQHSTPDHIYQSSFVGLFPVEPLLDRALHPSDRVFHLLDHAFKPPESLLSFFAARFPDFDLALKLLNRV